MPFRSARARRGFTLTEMIVVSAIGAMVGIGLMSLTIYGGRGGKAIRSQQRALREAQSAIEGINRAIRPAVVPLRLLDGDGNPAAVGNTVEFGWLDEPLGRRLLRLESVDADLATPWDNTLIYDPDTTRDGDAVTLAGWIAPADAAGAFAQNTGGSLAVRLRIGDPPAPATPAARAADTAVSGQGLQGIDITLTVTPRN